MPPHANRRLGWGCCPRGGRAGVGRVRREDFGEWDRRRGEFRGIERAEEGASKTSNEGSGDVVRVSLDHEGVVLYALFGEVKVSDGGREEDAGDDGGGRGTEAPPKGDLVGDGDIYDGGGREGEVVGEEDVEGDAGDEVLVRVQGRFGRAFADVAENDGARSRFARGESDVEGEVSGEGDAQDVEARSDVGRRRGDADGPLQNGKGLFILSENHEELDELTFRSPAEVEGAGMSRLGSAGTQVSSLSTVSRRIEDTLRGKRLQMGAKTLDQLVVPPPVPLQSPSRSACLTRPAESRWNPVRGPIYDPPRFSIHLSRCSAGDCLLRVRPTFWGRGERLG